MDASRIIHLCPYCDDVDEFSAPSEVLLLNHIRFVHSNDSDFSIVFISWLFKDIRKL